MVIVTLMTLPDHIIVGTKRTALTIRRNRQAKRMTLRVQPVTGEVVLSLPKRTSVKSGMDFLQEKTSWIDRQLQALPPRIPFADGAVIPLLGAMHKVRHVPEQRQVVIQKEGELLVGGDTTFLSRRLTDWLKKTARDILAQRARSKADRLGVTLRSVKVREMKTRWGSCSEEGKIAFCWRLIFAPEYVADYVVAHEVAHLKEMNHSRKFWAIVTSICDNTEAAKTWLKEHGTELYKYG